MSNEIHAGQTYVFGGTLAAGASLIGDAGVAGAESGALIEVDAKAFNNGTITLLANNIAYNGGATGATLAVSGVLTNAATGVITIHGGDYGYHYGPFSVAGAQLIDSGRVTNAGTIMVGAAVTGPSQEGSNGTGGLLLDSGVLTNVGLLEIQGGAHDYAGFAPGGTVSVTGVLHNAGSIQIAVSPTYYGNTGGVLSVAGQMTNAGTITLGGSSGGQYAVYAGAGGTLDVAGTLLTSGVIELQGGKLWYPGATGGYSGTGAQLIDSGTVANTGHIQLITASMARTVCMGLARRSP